jgi:UDP-2-acetamido-3-amino-2,3-dideoxy-glucuronate N-acetyltransferase
LIHSTAEVLTSQIGKDTKIWQFVVILPDAVIGNNCNINAHVFIENDVSIGNDVTIKSGVQLWDGIRIQDKVFIGPNVTFTNDLLPRSKQYPERFLRTTIQEGASIGANATIIGGITIGRYAMIGAGSVITKDIPPFTLWYGNPGTHKGYVTKFGEVLDLNLSSKVTGLQYVLRNQEPVLAHG